MGTVDDMNLTRRAAAFDLGVAVVAAGLAAIAAWQSAIVINTPIAGPPWIRAIWPLLIGAPLLLRRRAPLLMWILLWSAVALQAVISGDSTEGLELMFALFVGGYAVAAYSRSLLRAYIGLAITAAGLTIDLLTNHDTMSGQAENLWSAGFFIAVFAGLWLAGVFVRGRRQAAIQAERAAQLELRAAQAVADERARMARELHDIVSHNLSVVVLQAAGARTSGVPAASTLEKIERSGRQALVEMRRLLGVLREPDDQPALAPQPGIADLTALAADVRAVGLPVRLTITGDQRGLPPAVDVSAYRIVQEALTNVLKHAGPAHAEVALECGLDAVTIDVTDDGAGAAADPRPYPGHGLAGMRERVGILGGELTAGPRPGAGYAVHARLPLSGPVD